MENTSGYRTFTATAAALTAWERVKLDSSGNMLVAGADDDWIGVVVQDVAASGRGTVKLLSAPGSLQLTASAAIAAGAELFGTASGRVDDAGTTSTGYVSVEAATAAGDIIEAVPKQNNS